MKIIKQLAIILLISFLGEAVKSLLPFSVPASIYGLVLMFLALEFHVVKLDDVKLTGDFLAGNMQLMFIPSTVGLIAVWGTVKSMALPLAVIIPVTTALVMLVTGWLAQVLAKIGKDGSQK